MKKLLFAVTVTLCSLAAAELALRAFAPLHSIGVTEAFQYDSEFGYRLKPGVHVFRMTDHQEEARINKNGTVNFQQDFYGYRSIIFAVGDSLTQGVGLPADAAYPFQLDLILNRDSQGAYSKRFAVVNLGVAGFGGQQNLRALRRYASSLGKPSFVLYLGCDNDYGDDISFRSGSYHRRLVDQSPYWGWMLGPTQWLANTEIGKRARLIAPQLRQHRTAILPSGGAAVATTRSDAELEQPVLGEIARTCSQLGAKLVISWVEAPSPSYDWVKSWAARNEVAFANWLPAVDSVRSAIPRIPLDNPHSGGHRRSWVTRLMAEAYAKQIEMLDNR